MSILCEIEILRGSVSLSRDWDTLMIEDWTLVSDTWIDCGLLMPQKNQKAYFILRAFNAEIASIKGEQQMRSRGDLNVQEMPKQYALQMRFQWWLDAIRQIYGEEQEREHDPSLLNLSISCWESPIVRALYYANNEVQFTRRFLERLIEARQTDCEINQFTTLDESTNYAERSVSNLLYLTLECCGVSSSCFKFFVAARTQCLISII